MLKLTVQENSIVISILSKLIPGISVFAFGSRTNGNADRKSDLDLLIVSDTPLATDILADLRQAFSDSTIPFRVDIIESCRTDSVFLKQIQKQSMQII